MDDVEDTHAVEEDAFEGLRRAMVDCQLRTYDITDRALLAAADEVPREAFLPPSLSHMAYLDQAVPLPGTRRALMTPMVIVRMIQSLDVEPGETALEFGGGTGYGAALMAHMGAVATLWEPDAEAFAMSQTVLSAEGVLGGQSGATVSTTATRPANESFDVVLVNGACEIVPEDLFALLRQGGRLVAIDGTGRSARVKLYQKSGETVSGRPIFDAAAPVLDEFRRVAAFVF